MNLEKIESQINDKRKSLEIIEADIAIKKAELDDWRKSYSKGILQHVGKEKQPASVQTQRDKVTSCEVEYQGLIGVRELLLEEITNLERERDLAVLYETEAQSFQNSMVTCEDAVEKMTNAGKRLTEDIRNFTEAVGVLFTGSEKAISGFSSVYTKLDRNISLEAFMRDGETVEIEKSDHEVILLLTGKDLQKFSFIPDAIDPASVDKLLSCVKELGAWRRTVATYDPPGALMLTHKSLRRVKSKAFAVDSETGRAHRVSEAKEQRTQERKQSNLEKLREQIPKQAPVRTRQAIR